MHRIIILGTFWRVEDFLEQNFLHEGDARRGD